MPYDPNRELENQAAPAHLLPAFTEPTPVPPGADGILFPPNSFVVGHDQRLLLTIESAPTEEAPDIHKLMFRIQELVEQGLAKGQSVVVIPLPAGVILRVRDWPDIAEPPIPG